MDVMILATRECKHCSNLKKELEDIGVEYQLVYVDEVPELVDKLEIRHLPNIVIDREIALHGQPSEAGLRKLFNC